MLKNKISKICYVAISDNVLTKSNLDLLKIASSYGDVVVGLLSDEAILNYKSPPLLNFKQRKMILQNIKYVSKIILQSERDYSKNLKLLKPDFVFHKKNYWNQGVQKEVRKKIKILLNNWKGKLIEVDIKINPELENLIKYNPDYRKNKLSRLISSKKIVRLLEAHNSLSALIVEKLKLDKKNEVEEFDGIWCSSLADSTVRAKPDNQSVDLNTRINALNEILETTTKPILFDADNGGSIEHLPFTVKNLERLGISGIVMEDKIGSKQNSLFDNQKASHQDTIVNFCKKIKVARESRITKDLLIVARIESLIMNKGMKDAVKRAENYSKAGADLILIHSKAKNPKEIFQFARIFKKSKFYKPMICVPSTYSNTSEKELIKNGFKVVIYANQLIRSVYPAMLETAKSILVNKKSKKIENKISTISEILRLIKS